MYVIIGGQMELKDWFTKMFNPHHFKAKENKGLRNKEVANVCAKCGSDLKWFVTRYRCRNLDCRAEYPHNS